MLLQEHARQGELPPPVADVPGPGPVTGPPPEYPALGRAVLSAILLAIGLLAIADLSGASMPGAIYVAVPLALTGLGLILGAWFAKVRWLIALGAVLSVVLAVMAAADGFERASDVSWKPAGIQQLDPTYHINVGNAVLDLSSVSFAGQQKSVEASIQAGNLTIIVPADVDVVVQARVGVGNANVLGTKWNGVGQPARDVTDFGLDGPGGGRLTLEASVDVGDLEVRR